MNYRQGFTCLLTLLLLLALTACAGPHHRRHRPGPRQVEACFYNLNEVYQNRVYPCLNQTPGVFDLSRSWKNCGRRSRNCLCYQLYYEGPIDELIRELRTRLPVTKTVPFSCRALDESRLEVIFDGGFK